MVYIKLVDMDKIIPITELRRNFGEITADLARIDSLILTKGGKPFAVLKTAPELKREKMKKFAGSLRNSDLGDENIWKEVLKRKSRKKPIII